MLSWLRERALPLALLLVAEYMMIWGTEGDVFAWIMLNVLAVLTCIELRRIPRVQRWLEERNV